MLDDYVQQLKPIVLNVENSIHNHRRAIIVLVHGIGLVPGHCHDRNRTAVLELVFIDCLFHDSFDDINSFVDFMLLQRRVYKEHQTLLSEPSGVWQAFVWSAVTN